MHTIQLSIQSFTLSISEELEAEQKHKGLGGFDIHVNMELYLVIDSCEKTILVVASLPYNAQGQLLTLPTALSLI